MRLNIATGRMGRDRGRSAYVDEASSWRCQRPRWRPVVARQTWTRTNGDSRRHNGLVGRGDGTTHGAVWWPADAVLGRLGSGNCQRGGRRLPIVLTVTRASTTTVSTTRWKTNESIGRECLSQPFKGQMSQPVAFCHPGLTYI